MKRIAVFPGSFDPITKGHEDIILRAIPLFDEIIVAIGTNSSKNYYYSLEKRLDMIRYTFRNEPKVKVETYLGMTVDYCKEVGATHLLRGLRTSADFEFERSIAHINQTLHPDIDTVFLLSLQEYSAINSTIVRDILSNGGDPQRFVPEGLDLTK
ncbi:MAG TPA: pantetheine-phosphate adenylyltransferase [Flavobacteriales bacterium]|nr:pantetheine-phosphate adenylyltransferase [Flavobacteriales bacterium]